MHFALATILPLLVGASIYLLISRKLAATHHRTLMGIVSLLLVAVGTAMSIHAISVFHFWQDRSDWPTATATVTESSIVGNRVNDPLIRYTYSVGGVEYTGSTKMRAPGFGGKNKRLEVAEEVTEHNPVGSSLEVHYDPADPSVSFTSHRPPWNAYMKLTVGILFSLAGSYLAMLLVLRPKKRGVRS